LNFHHCDSIIYVSDFLFSKSYPPFFNHQKGKFVLLLEPYFYFLCVFGLYFFVMNFMKFQKWQNKQNRFPAMTGIKIEVFNQLLSVRRNSRCKGKRLVA